MRPPRIGARAIPIVILASTFHAACGPIERAFEKAIDPRTPHEAYEASLAAAGLERTALAQRWRTAAVASLGEPVRVDPPFEEAAFFPAEEPTAAAYVVSLERGQKIFVEVGIEGAGIAPPASTPAGSVSDTGTSSETTGFLAPAPGLVTGTVALFIDLFRLGPDGEPERLASADEGARELEFEAAQAGDFLIRLQPELLLDVRVRLRLLRAASLAFPVAGQGTEAVLSGFGAPRDAGRRSHQGVDIFAPRGTPVLAAADGVVRRAGTQRLGGLVVWLRDERRGYSHYYAHLDSQLVVRGERVRRGDTIGLVGNTGNARTTPPHLHFGLYRRGEGAVDPWYFVAPQPSDPPPVRGDTTRLGEWVRIARRTSATIPASGSGETLDPYTVVRVLGAHGSRLRVRLPDGRLADLRATGLESLASPIDRARVAAGEPVLSAPDPAAVARDHARESGTLPVVGRFGRYVLVRSDRDIAGWIALSR